MPTDITPYTEKIARAVYGEEVRGSINSALKKINDDNNSYNALKEEVKACHTDVKRWHGQVGVAADNIQKADKDLTNKISQAKTAETELDMHISSAQTAIQQAQATGSDLNTAINNGESTIADLQSANLSGQAMIDLMVSQTSSAQQVNSQLGDSLTTGTALSSALNATIQEGTACAETLSGLIDTAEGLGGSGLVIDLTDWGSPCGDPFGYVCHNLELYNLVLNSLKKGVFPVIYYSGSYLQTYYAETTYLCGANGLNLYFHQKNPCGVPTYTSNLLIYDN